MDKNSALLEKRALLQETDSEDEEDQAYARGKQNIVLAIRSRHNLFWIF